RENAAIQWSLADLLTCDRCRHLIGLRLDSGYRRTLDCNLSIGRPYLQGCISSGLLRHAKNDSLSLILLEPSGRDCQIIGSWGQSADQILAFSIRRGRAINALLRAADPHLSAFDCRAAGIGDGAGDGCGVLSEEARGNNENE